MSKISRLMKVRLALLSIPVIVVGVNIAAIKSIDPLAALMIESRILAQIDSVSRYPVIRLFNQILPVILAFIAIIIYVSTVFRSLWKQQDGKFDLQEKTVLRLLEMPFYIALFISITWMLGVPVVPLANDRLLYRSARFKKIAAPGFGKKDCTLSIYNYGNRSSEKPWLTKTIKTSKALRMPRSALKNWKKS
ncbi:hypothetical protein [Salinispira pacifica]|uniref:hypothetical protein n=1 Tax=Salinispira pacifica TaxID=1307761 RepID=UPI00059BE495|nr:hypothetical protein [Salinispira pacifica]